MSFKILTCTGHSDVDGVFVELAKSIRDCEVHAGPFSSFIDKNGDAPEVAIFMADLQDHQACEGLLLVLNHYFKNSFGKLALLILENAKPDRECLDLQKRFVAAGVGELVERPLNLQRLRYVIESNVIKKHHPILRPQLATRANYLAELERKIAKVAAADTNVLLTGETGVGKTYWAKRIHELSARSNEPFIVVNCANFTPSLAESELFGHVKGAFTGADDNKVGQFEHAGKGTIFLDELDSLPTEVQGKLLRVVDDHEFNRMGDRKNRSMLARIISATNVQLLEQVQKHSFRGDLYYRMNGYGIHIPPIRERTEEIASFCVRFLTSYCESHSLPAMTFEPCLLEVLAKYKWPGNVREIKNAIEHGVIDADDGVIKLINLPVNIQAGIDQNGLAESSTSLLTNCDNIAKGFGRDDLNDRLVTALNRNNNNRAQAARELGVSRMTVYNWIKRFGLN